MIRKLFIKTKWLYKYGMPIIFFMIVAAYNIISHDIYTFSYTIVNETLGASLFMCYREYYEAIIRGKCMWQKASIISVAVYCIMNIIFSYTGYEDPEKWMYFGFFIGSLSIVVFFIKEEYYDRYFCGI